MQGNRKIDYESAVRLRLGGVFLSRQKNLASNSWLTLTPETDNPSSFNALTEQSLQPCLTVVISVSAAL